jgi:Sin3 associated polypeptide p18 (SAP18)
MAIGVFKAMLSLTLSSNATRLQVGTVHATQPGIDDNKSLHDVKFQIGDFMDVAILIPRMPAGMPPDRRFGGPGGPPQRRGGPPRR